MKSKLVLLIAILCSAISYAQVGNFGVGTALPGSKLTLNGSFAAPYTIYTATGSIGANDYYVASNGTLNDTLTLPAATAAAPAAGNIKGRVYRIKNTGTTLLTVAAAGSEQIDNQSGAGLANIVVNPGYYLDIVSKGTTGATTTWEAVILASTGTGAGLYSSVPLVVITTNTYGTGASNPYVLGPANVGGVVYFHSTVTQAADIILPSAATYKGAVFSMINRSTVTPFTIKTTGGDMIYFAGSGATTQNLVNTNVGTRLLSTGLNWVNMP